MEIFIYYLWEYKRVQLLWKKLAIHQEIKQRSTIGPSNPKYSSREWKHVSSQACIEMFIAVFSRIVSEYKWTQCQLLDGIIKC